MNLLLYFNTRKKSTKIALIVIAAFLLAGIIFSILVSMLVKTLLVKETETETYQIALEYLMNTDEVRQKYDSDARTDLIGVDKSLSSSSRSRIQYRFRFPSTGEQYTVYLYKQDDGWLAVLAE